MIQNLAAMKRLSILGLLAGTLFAQTDSADSLLSRGVTALLAGHLAEAAVSLRQAVKLNPASTRAKDALAASMAAMGQCRENGPALKRAATRETEPNLKRTIAVTGVRCAMSLNEPGEALSFLQLLGRDFPNDPDVLYLQVHVYSDLSIRASQDLMERAPASYQVHQLNAEALEAQNRWDDAAAEYRSILAKNPHLPGIHYRLGRILLSQPKSEAAVAEAKREFEAELADNPDHAGAEFVLGELARQADNWPDAAKHFGHAARLDSGFAEAHLGLGKSLLADNHPQEAIAPLLTAAKLQPGNPEPHYHLAVAYRRTGHKQDGDREANIHQTLSDKARAEADARKQGAPGPQGDR